ncbi:MAG: hypothetical protein GX272_07885 [Epulopiscium sp.]|nr:hypothetical protein [Candidatus Epulonipiscium sp.]
MKWPLWIRINLLSSVTLLISILVYLVSRNFIISIVLLCIGYILQSIYVYLSVKPLKKVIQAVKEMQYGNGIENTNNKKPKNEIQFILDGINHIPKHVEEYTTNINNVLIEVEGIVERLKGNTEKILDP